MLRLRSFASRESHSLTNFGSTISIYKKAIGYSDSLFCHASFDRALLFSFLQFLDLFEDFAGLADDLTVDAETDQTSYYTSDCGTYQDNHTAGFIRLDQFVHTPGIPQCYKHGGNRPCPSDIMSPDTTQRFGYFDKATLREVHPAQCNFLIYSQSKAYSQQ